MKKVLSLIGGFLVLMAIIILAMTFMRPGKKVDISDVDNIDVYESTPTEIRRIVIQQQKKCDPRFYKMFSRALEEGDYKRFSGAMAHIVSNPTMYPEEVFRMVQKKYENEFDKNYGKKTRQQIQQRNVMLSRANGPFYECP